MIAASAIVLLASFVQSVTGFGFCLVATPLLLFVFETKSVVVIGVILNAVLCALILLHSRQHIDIRRVALICVGSIFGIPLGAYLLSSINPSMIKLVIAVLVIPFSVFLLLGKALWFKRDSLGCGTAGFVSGALTTSTSLSGPPVVLFLLNQGLVKKQFVATLAAYFLFCSLVSIGAFSFIGMVTTGLLMDIITLLPTLVIGFYAGIKVRPKINAALFKRIATSVILVTALTLIVTFLLEST